MRRSVLTAPFAAVALFTAGAALPAAACAQSPAESQAEPGRLSLSAVGEVAAAPDMASITSGVVTEADTAQAAVRANAQTMTRVFSALDEAGVAERDIQTSNFRVSQVYSNTRSGEERRITGFEARNTVTARVRDVDAVGGVIDALVGAGANQLQGVNFGLEDRQAAEDEARRRAVAELQRLSALYAEAADIDIARLVSLSEQQNYSGPRPAMMMRAEAMDSAPTPIAGGELSVTVRLNAVYEIEG